ncbi:protein phosphatase 2C family protein [Actinidia rufa]|uniref:Protein phosphatase 2C family protein n=1 Tax=Actinidia rufa TaxID=165716 RepID=A0A7J0GMI4_9ERIC|nr:protein phosphatase 2C family protein [Actinidia rufa]
MSVQEVVDFVREQKNTENKLLVVCERVLDNCIAPCVEGRSGCDNMTMILVQFKKPTLTGRTDDVLWQHRGLETSD